MESSYFDTPVDPRRMKLLNKQCAEQKKGRLLYRCNLTWMKNGGPISWNAILFSETSKISRQMGRHLAKDDSENHSKAELYRLVVEYHLISAKGSTKLVRTSYQEYSSDVHWLR